ncbi:hypothetical protein MHA_0984 [Mannheimia haemolytica PHL213]|nr:hypothetical protein MHA_0984 [Mannheimia haemolytica PHL213]
MASILLGIESLGFPQGTRLIFFTSCRRFIFNDN